MLPHLWDGLVKGSVYPRWFADWPGIEEKAVALIHLADSVSSRVSVHVVPNGVVHRGNTGAFVLATMEDRSEVGYLETNACGIVSAIREDVAELHESFEMIRNVALPVGPSVDLIRRTAEERWLT